MPGQLRCSAGQKWRHIGKAACDDISLGKPGPDRAQITRPPPIQSQAGQCPVDVRNLTKVGPQTVAQLALFRQVPHGVEPALDNAKIARRPGQPPLQQARSACSNSPVHGRQQRPVAPARQAGRDFQVAPRRRINLHRAALRLGDRGPQQGKFAALCQIQIVDDGTHRRQVCPVE